MRRGLIVLLALLAAGCGQEPKPLEPMQVALLRSTVGSFVRAVTVEGGCRVAAQARVVEEGGALRFTILGRDPAEGGCTADIKVRCVELELSRPPGERPLRATHPASSDYLRDARRMVTADVCPVLPVKD